jgi:hypothetical protein
LKSPFAADKDRWTPITTKDKRWKGLILNIEIGTVDFRQELSSAFIGFDRRLTGFEMAFRLTGYSRLP